MDSEARNPADTTRLRLVDLRVDGEHLLHFGGGFSVVLAGNGTRSAAARAIASTIVGPRPTGASGAIDIAGSLVSVWSLPAPLLPLDAPMRLNNPASKLLAELLELPAPEGAVQSFVGNR